MIKVNKSSKQRSMNLKPNRLFLNLVILFLIGLTSCITVPDNPRIDIGLTVEAEIGLKNQTRKTLENAIDELGRQPGRWEETLSNTINELGEISIQTAREVLDDVQALYTRSLGQTAGTTFCGEEYFATRIQQRLQEILHRFFDDTPEPHILPVVCLTEPEHVIPGETRLLKFYGFDFLEFGKDKEFLVDLQYSSGQLVKRNFGHVSITDNYLLQLDFQGEDFTGLDRTRGPQIVLKWGDQMVATDGAQSELPVLLPTLTPYPTLTPIPTLTPTPTATATLTPIPRHRIIITGRIDVTDYENFGSNEHAHLNINELITLSPGESRNLSFEVCAGGEVRIELEVGVNLREDDKIAVITILAKMYEGTTCHNNDYEGGHKVTIEVAPNSPASSDFRLWNKDEGDDYADFYLRFTNGVITP